MLKRHFLPMRKDWPRWTPTQYFNVSGEKGANRRNTNKQIFMAKIILKYDIIELKNLLLKVENKSLESLNLFQKALGPGKNTAGVTYLPFRICPESCCIFPLKVVATLLSGSRKGTVGAE